MSSSSPAGSQPTPESPNFSEILGYLSGALQMMLGRSEGLRRLDLTADGFWTSFLAVPVALPPMALSWIEYEDVQRQVPVAGSGPAIVYGAHAVADLVAWVLPIALLMLVARASDRRRFRAYLVNVQCGCARPGCSLSLVCPSPHSRWRMGPGYARTSREACAIVCAHGMDLSFFLFGKCLWG